MPAACRLIFDEDAESKVQTAVQSLCAYLIETHGVTVPLYADTKMAAFPYEILIGETVRKESVM